jgi:hypothetical protein
VKLCKSCFATICGSKQRSCAFACVAVAFAETRPGLYEP